MPALTEGRVQSLTSTHSLGESPHASVDPQGVLTQKHLQSIRGLPAEAPWSYPWALRSLC